MSVVETIYICKLCNKYPQTSQMCYVLKFDVFISQLIWCPGLFLVWMFYSDGWDMFDLMLYSIQRNLTGSKISTSSTKFVFFGPIAKPRWPPWPLIGWDIFDSFSETPEMNSTNFTGSKISTSSTKFVFLGSIRKPRSPPWPLIDWNNFDFSETAERNFTGSKILMSSTTFVFFGMIEIRRYGRPGLWLIETFSISSLKPLNGIHETWQEARSQCPLPSLCFSGRSENEDGRPGLWLA